MEPNLDKLNFYSGVNYMKRSDKSGQSTINTSDVDVDHNLGYVPQFAVYAELDGDGFLWHGGERVFEGTESTSGGGTYPPVVDAWSDENTLTMHPLNFLSAEDVFWLIYLDYGV